MQAHRIVDRLSDDVDLFAPIDRATNEMPAAVAAAVAAYEAAGYTVEVVQQVPTYTRMNVTDPVTGSRPSGSSRPPLASADRACAKRCACSR